MTFKMMVIVSCAIGFIGAVGMIVNGAPRKNFVKAFLLTSAILLVLLASVSLTLHYMTSQFTQRAADAHRAPARGTDSGFHLRD